MMRKVLVLAPHTDDGEFGCGGTIARMCRNGDEVHYIAFSAAEKSVPKHLPPGILRTELRAAASILGLQSDRVSVLDFEVRVFPEHRQEILECMLRLNETIRPDMVLLPSVNDTHQDHAVIAAEGFRAFKRTTMLGYEIPWNNLDFRTSCFVLLDDECAERKVNALACYESQRHRPYASAESVRSLLVTRGTQVGHKYAEAFDVIRWVLS